MGNTISLQNMGKEEYHLPRAPNFIRRVHDDFPVPYGELSNAQIEKIGRAWTQQLLERAEQQRKNATEFDLPARRGMPK